MFQITDLVNYERNSPFYPCVPLFCGIETCTGGHSYGPRIRDYILIHFVLSGRGEVVMEGSSYEVSGGQAFVIPAGLRCRYVADEADPWEYCWVAFYAPVDILSVLFPSSAQPHVRQNVNVQYVKSIILKMIASQFSFPKNQYEEKESDSGHLHLATNFELAFSYEMTASLYQILACLIDQKDGRKSEQENRMQDIRKYIDCYYNESIRVKTVAREFALHPNYLTALFKAEFGVTPRQYIIDRRIAAACHFLETTDYPVKDIAYMVGYEDQLAFSQLFRKKTGKSPSDYRRERVGG